MKVPRDAAPMNAKYDVIGLNYVELLGMAQLSVSYSIYATPPVSPTDH
jgi:hypothetical protein